jgi:predicted naringenin-chalcone synthase
MYVPSLCQLETRRLLALSVQWMGQGTSLVDLVGPNSSVGPDGVADVRLHLSGLLTASGANIIQSVVVTGPPGAQGQTVFKWASFQIAKFAKEAMAAAGVGPEDIDVFVPHQANLRIIDQLVKQLHLPDSVVVARDIVDTGNTSAASIPLAIERLVEDGLAKSGDVALQIGFGAGLVYAAQVVVLP